MRARALLPFFFAASVPIFLGRGLIVSSSATYDEPVHLAAGYTDLVHGRYRLNAMDHPPLAEMWAALPLLALKPAWFPTHPDWVGARLYHYGDHFLYHNRVPFDRLLNAARLWNLATVTLLVAWCVVAWGRRLGGEAGAWGSSIAFSFCVPWLSNAALVTTDALSAGLFFVSLYLLSSPLERSLGRWAIAGAAVGAAMGSKFNMILLPVFAVISLIAETRFERPSFSKRGAFVSLVVAVSVLAAVYRFTFVDLYWKGLFATLERLSQGRPSYLMGRHSSEGVLLYFPAALLVKTPLPLIIAGMAGIWGILRRRLSAEHAWLLLPPLLYFAVALTAKTQIGYRHILPIYPFLCVVAGAGAAWAWELGPRARSFAFAVAVWLAISVLRVHPHHLAYFNELAGGPARGVEWLADSNLDWGQDLPALARALEVRGNPVVLLSYFGTADPSAYGIRFVPLGMYGNVDRPSEAAVDPKGPVLFAVSATNRAGVYFREHDVFAWLKTRTPAAVLGGSLFLYDVTSDADARARLAAILAGSGRAGDAKALMLHSGR